MSFSDHFSSLASNYATYRPSYPDSLFAWLAHVAPSRNLAWDCACGSGQASKKLAGYFDHVIATDASEAQLREVEPNPKIDYHIALAEKSGLASGSADLITVAQAAHWFKLDEFYVEAKRVLKPGGVIALWTYDHIRIEDQKLMSALTQFIKGPIESYWPPERSCVVTGYRTLPFPFIYELTPPDFRMDMEWSLPRLTGYFRSWSAVKYFKAAQGFDPVDALESEIKPLWGPPDLARRLSFKLFIRAARV